MLQGEKRKLNFCAHNKSNISYLSISHELVIISTAVTKSMGLIDKIECLIFKKIYLLILIMHHIECALFLINIFSLIDCTNNSHR